MGLDNDHEGVSLVWTGIPVDGKLKPSEDSLILVSQDLRSSRNYLPGGSLLVA